MSGAAEMERLLALAAQREALRLALAGDGEQLEKARALLRRTPPASFDRTEWLIHAERSAIGAAHCRGL